MQICRQKALCKLAAVAGMAFFAFSGSSGAFAQSSSGYDSFSSIGSISSPEMPTVSSPTMGSGFYMPGNNSNPIYTGSQSSSVVETPKKTESKEEKSSTTTTSLLSTLTASDISSLDSLGLLNQVTSLYSSDTSSLSSLSSISNLYTSSSSNVTNLLLQKVLTELEGLKAQNSTNEETASKETPQSESETSAAKSANATKTSLQSSSSTNFKSELQDSGTKRNNPKILRFSVNGYDILSTCRTIYISQIQGNGSFLVTGDRRYISDGKSRTETFHILFKPNEASNGISSYSTATGVTQDYMNTYSFLYQLSQMDGLNAQRTGNLVSLRTSDPNWKLELLLDLGE